MKLKQLKGAYIHWAPINAWLPIQEKLVDMGAYIIMGYLFSIGAYYGILRSVNLTYY